MAACSDDPKERKMNNFKAKEERKSNRERIGK